ncbi:MAG: hypothetical protein J6W00_00310 [Lentisphaeria bacterium]|nr:hypothetical protein [Lentisphaeria bacterium]
MRFYFSVLQKKVLTEIKKLPPTAAVPLVAAVVTTVWFIFGGIRDMRQLFKDLSNRLENPLDNGQVEGEISLADSASFCQT